MAVVLLISGHLGGAVYGMALLNGHGSHLRDFFLLMNLHGGEFFSQLFTTGLFLYFAAICALNVGLRPRNYFQPTLGIFALSFATSILLSSDRSKQLSFQDGAEPESFSSMVYLLLTQRHSLLFLSAFTFILICVLGYYLIRTFFRVEYTGSGIEIKLPGQVMYYMPVYPQISWQKTGIKVREGEKLLIELNGYVSPGALQEIGVLNNHIEEFVKWQKNGGVPEDWKGQAQTPTWPYSGPEGYSEEFYRGDRKLKILKQHPIYQIDDFYKKDACLTVQGLPHNKVLGYIQANGESAPREAAIGMPAYNWDNPEDKQELLCLSSQNYPMDVQPRKSGELWVVINDVDLARWDNSGLFFLKVTRNSWR